MSAEKYLLQLPLFRLAFLAPVVGAFIVWIVIFTNNDIFWDFSVGGFNQFISIYKVPLGILALIFPAIALVASNHRSVQASEQIRLSDSQNNFVNYFTHFDRFIDIVEEYRSKLTGDDRRYIADDGLKQCYSAIYPKTKHGDYNISDKLLTKLTEHLEYLSSQFTKFRKEDKCTIDNTGTERSVTDKAIHLLMWDCVKFFDFVGKELCIPNTVRSGDLNILEMTSKVKVIKELIPKLLNFYEDHVLDIDLSEYDEIEKYISRYCKSSNTQFRYFEEAEKNKLELSRPK